MTEAPVERDIVALYREVERLTGNMLSAAHQSDWDRLVELEAGKSYRLHLMSMDWLHGFSLQPENINIQVHPGYDHVVTVTPTSPGTYSILCNEYCGINHHTMASRLYVVK